MAKRYVEANALIQDIEQSKANNNHNNSIAYQTHSAEHKKFIKMVLDQPTADVVEVETIKAWLYGMAINNVCCFIDRDFSNACEEIIARLDGLRNFAKERSEGDGRLYDFS